MHREEHTKDSLFLAYLSMCFTCLQGYASVCGSGSISTPKEKETTHTSAETLPGEISSSGRREDTQAFTCLEFSAERLLSTTPGYARHVQKFRPKGLDVRKPSDSRVRLRGALQTVSAMSPH